MAKLREIKGLYRVSFKQKTTIGDVYYTIEYGESYDEITEQDNIQEIKEKMWNEINNEVSSKCKEITGS